MRNQLTRVALAAMLAGGMACSDNPTTPASFSLSAASSSLNLAAGTFTTMVITVDRNSGFAGSINLSAEGLPTGVTAVFVPATLTSGINTSALTLTALGTVTAGNSNITVRGVASGSGDATDQIALTLTSATSGTSLTVNPATVSVAQGGVATSAVALTRTGGFTGDVVLSATGLPTGVTASFAPATLPNGTTTSTVTFTASGSATTGMTTITVHATGTGIAEKTVTVALTVNTSS